MKITKQNIIKALVKEEYIKNKKEAENTFDFGGGINLFSQILGQYFGVELSLSDVESESDYWVQADYYSKTLQKAIIWDYDVPVESISQLIDYFLETEKEVIAFEKRISLKK